MLPSASVTSTVSSLPRCSSTAVAGTSVGEPVAVPLPLPGGSEAGKEPESGCSVPSAPAAWTLKAFRVSRKAAFESVSAIRSCGRFGPAIAGITSPRSSSSVSENVGSSASGVWNMPCSRV